MYFSNKDEGLPVKQDLVDVGSVLLVYHLAIDGPVPARVNIDPGDLLVQLYFATIVVLTQLLHFRQVQPDEILQLALKGVQLLDNYAFVALLDVDALESFGRAGLLNEDTRIIRNRGDGQGGREEAEYKDDQDDEKSVFALPGQKSTIADQISRNRIRKCVLFFSVLELLEVEAILFFEEGHVRMAFSFRLPCAGVIGCLRSLNLHRIRLYNSV